MIYVVDMGNARVERFDALGDFVGIWGGDEGGNVELAQTDAGLGPTGIAVGPDGLIYVSDTWNHRIVVVDPTGQRRARVRRVQDTERRRDPNVEPGFFFGPRDVAVTDDEIYVVDTGNERVQVFGLDGTFLRAWGGFGTEPGATASSRSASRSATTAASTSPTPATPGSASLPPTGRRSSSGRSMPGSAASTSSPISPSTQDGFLYATSSATGSIEVFDRTAPWSTRSARSAASRWSNRSAWQPRRTARS